MLVQHAGTYSPILDTSFPTTGRSQQLWTKNNGKSIIPEDSDEKHYYYRYIIPRLLIYSGPCIFIPRLSGFFYRPGYGSASSLGNG